MQYSEYLQTEHWKETRFKRIRQHNWCSVCKGKENLQIHHKRYKGRDGRSLLFREQPTTLVPLCPSCHRLLQHYLGINVIKLNKKICRIRRYIEFGISKKMAFYLVSKDPTGQLFISLRKKLSN